MGLEDVILEGVSRIEAEDIDNRFTYHKPFDDQNERYVELREEARELALKITSLCPVSRERSLAITHLEQAVMWANASIARNERGLSKL